MGYPIGRLGGEGWGMGSGDGVWGKVRGEGHVNLHFWSFAFGGGFIGCVDLPELMDGLEWATVTWFLRCGFGY